MVRQQLKNEMFKHKFKIGEKVIVKEREGVIHTLGFATPGSSKFTTCSDKKEVSDEHLLGYQVAFSNSIKIVKETDVEKI